MRSGHSPQLAAVKRANRNRYFLTGRIFPVDGSKELSCNVSYVKRPSLRDGLLFFG